VRRVCLLAASLCLLVWLGLRGIVQLAQAARTAQGVLHPARPARPAHIDRYGQATLARLLGQAGMMQADHTRRWSLQDWLRMQAALALSAALLGAGSARLLQTSFSTLLLVSLLAAALAFILPLVWLHARVRERQRRLLRELPFFLDLLTLCVEAGLSLQSALQQATQYGPPGLLRQEMLHVLAQLRTGLARADAFDALYTRTGVPDLAQFALSLRQSDQFGISLGAVLRAQAARQRDARFIRAEKLALQAPVKMLFPLVCCIFPCTFLILGLPLLASFLNLLD